MQFMQESGKDGCWYITKVYVLNQEANLNRVLQKVSAHF